MRGGSRQRHKWEKARCLLMGARIGEPEIGKRPKEGEIRKKTPRPKSQVCRMKWPTRVLSGQVDMASQPGEQNERNSSRWRQGGEDGQRLVTGGGQPADGDEVRRVARGSSQGVASQRMATREGRQRLGTPRRRSRREGRVI